MMNRTAILLACVTLMIGVAAAQAGPDAAAVRAELERVEDLRVLHGFAVQDLHDARALAIYLSGWGGPDRMPRVEDLFIEGESLYGQLRGIDHGATAAQAELDVLGSGALSPAAFELLQRARGDVAGTINDFYRRCDALKTALAADVTAAAQQKAKWELTSQPEPWPDARREAGRDSGLRFGWALTESFFGLPEQDGDYLLRKEVKMGGTFVNVFWDPVSDWATMEPTPGNYDFAAADKVAERFARQGFKVALMLRSLSGTPPAWLVQQEGAECRFRARAKDRQGNATNEFSGINLFNEPAGKAYAAFLAAYAAHLKAKAPGVIEGVYVEGGQRELEAVADESAAMDAYWRQWSKTDVPWRTPESILADPQPDEAACVRAEMCREAWLLDYVSRVREALKRGWPELAVQNPTFSDDFHRMYAAAVGRSRNAPALCRLADDPSGASDSPANFTLMKSFSDGRWLWQMGIHSGCGTTGGAAGVQPPFYDAERVTIGSYAHCLRAFFPGNWFRYCDWQIGGFGLTSYYLTPRRSQEYGPVLMNTALPRADVAVLWSQSSLRRDRTRELWHSVMAFGHMLRRSFFDFDYVAEDGLAERLPRYRVLILSDTQSLPLGVCQAIRDWVNGGGILMGFGAPGLFDEYGKRRESLPLADVFGSDVARMREPAPVEPDRLYTGHPEGAFTSPAPLPFQYQATMTAALRPTGATPRAWYAGPTKEVAITENTFGKGRAMLCGYPLGFLYRESAPYEFAYGLSHHRTLSYNQEQKVYEEWIVKELEKAGVVRPVTVPSGRFLRGQLRDDGDWFHILSNGPKFQEYNLEEDRPARTIAAVTRRREGIDNVYVCLLHTEGNYFWERGHFRSTLAGGHVQVSVAVTPSTNATPVVFDARLQVPVPATLRKDRVEFPTWMPAAQGAVFAVAPDGKVRLFGEAAVHGEGPADVLARTAPYESAKGLAAVEILEPARIAEFLDARRGTNVVIGCGNSRYRPAAVALAGWLAKTHSIRAEVTMAGPRMLIRQVYMDGFGYGQVQPDPAKPDILVGNCQENGLMYRFQLLTGDNYWLPLEPNLDFPGAGRALVMLSVPVMTRSDGKPGGKECSQQLVIGAGGPAEAMQAVESLERAKGVGR